MDPNSRAAKKNANHRIEVLPQQTKHLMQRPFYNEEVCDKIRQAIGPHEDLLTIVKRPKLKWYGHVCRTSSLAKTISQGTAKRGKKTKHAEKEVGGQHQGLDRLGVRQVPQGTGENKKMEETDCKVICGAPTTPAVKG